MKKKKVNILQNGRSEDFDSARVSLEKLEGNLLILDTFGRMVCPICGYELLTPMDAKCGNCGALLGKDRAPLDKDGTKRLPGGITAKEATDRARKWWDGRMRDYFRRTRERRGDPIRMTPEMHAKRGILAGKKWDELNRREKFLVVKAWHQAWLEESVIDPNTGEAT